MARVIRSWIFGLVIACIFAATACSGGGNTVAGGGIGGSGIKSSGEITDFGSIWVNGREFDTRQADIYINNFNLGNGDQAVIENLDIGRIVCVKGLAYDAGYGTAEAVYYASTVTGPIDTIESIDAYTKKLTVLGQSVIIDDRTWVKSGVIDAFESGNLVEVSGLFDGTGNIVASFLSKTADEAPSSSLYCVSGPVCALSTDTFSINNLTVDYSQADISGFSESGLENDTFVTVSGRFDMGKPNILVADTVLPYRLPGGLLDGDDIDFAGYVFDPPTADQFLINGHLAEIRSDTQYDGGTAADILPGSKVKVQGFYSTGRIITQKIRFNAPMRAESILGQKDGTALSLQLINLEGLTIRTNSLTRYLGVVRSFENLAQGDHLVIKGHLVDDQTAVASQVISLPPAPGLARISLRGTITAVSDPLITINGVRIDTDRIPTGGYHAYNNEAISQEEFFILAGENDSVEAQGDLLADDSVSWQSISLVRLQ